MFCTSKENIQINCIHERALRILYKDDILSYEQSFEKYGPIFNFLSTQYPNNTISCQSPKCTMVDGRWSMDERQTAKEETKEVAEKEETIWLYISLPYLFPTKGWNQI